MKNLIVEVARGGRNMYGHVMRGWKIMTGGIVVSRFHKAKDARKFAKNLRKLYARPNVDLEDRWHEEEFEPIEN
jgi:hypothetical protein